MEKPDFESPCATPADRLQRPIVLFLATVLGWFYESRPEQPVIATAT